MDGCGPSSEYHGCIYSGIGGTSMLRPHSVRSRKTKQTISPMLKCALAGTLITQPNAHSCRCWCMRVEKNCTMHACCFLTWCIHILNTSFFLSPSICLRLCTHVSCFRLPISDCLFVFLFVVQPTHHITFLVPLPYEVHPCLSRRSRYYAVGISLYN